MWHEMTGSVTRIALLIGIGSALVPGLSRAEATAPQQGSCMKEASKDPSKEEDPFADITQARIEPAVPERTTERSWRESFFGENFGFRKEVMSQFNTGKGAHGASRQSIGFELLKKFSTETETVASFNFQGRLVRRDGFLPVLNDMEGETRRGWAFEYHNLYLDFYNVLNPFLREDQRGKHLGRFNLRAGRFYVPFGLNVRTDTHGTVLQLSNERNFGFERDWYTGFWGVLNQHLNYEVYYLVGSGYDLRYDGQSGLGAIRLSLGNKFSSEYGFEAGLSFIGGERLSRPAAESVARMNHDSDARPVTMSRTGADARYRRAVPTGLLTLTTEISTGRDAYDGVFAQLYQGEYLHSSRRWGAASQFRRFNQNGLGSDSSFIGELTWYFRNDVGNSNLHWIKLNLERQVQRMRGPPDTIITLQYYFYR
jgi:hypothetical protein